MSAHEKTEGPTTRLGYFGLLIDTEKNVNTIQDDKVLELKSKIKWFLGKQKIT